MFYDYEISDFQDSLVKLVITGNIDYPTVLKANKNKRYFSIDGRLDDLLNNYDNS